MSRRPPFCNFLTASGHGEIWDHTDEKKFKQFGWRCTTNETEYSRGTLIGNWNEERFDTRSMAKRRPLPSQYGHYFQTSHSLDFKTRHKIKHIPDHVKKTGGVPPEPRSFPSHQPELLPDQYKLQFNSYETTSRSAYKDPRMSK